MLAAISNEIVLVMEEPTLASTVEMTDMARSFVARTYAPLEVVLVANTVYLIFGLVLAHLFRFLERHLAPPVR